LGGGAFLTENRTTRLLRVSNESNPQAMTIALSRSHPSADVDVVQHDLGINKTIHYGSMGLKVGLICEGRAHLYLHSNRHTSQWDACAPDVILHEAGGRMTDVHNDPLRYNDAEVRNLRGVLASNGTIHDRIAGVAQAVLAGTSR
jgi:3'(2'), 5'-bisphosphate nucleotidase